MKKQSNHACVLGKKLTEFLLRLIPRSLNCFYFIYPALCKERQLTLVEGKMRRVIYCLHIIHCFIDLTVENLRMLCILVNMLIDRTFCWSLFCSC